MKIDKIYINLLITFDDILHRGSVWEYRLSFFSRSTRFRLSRNIGVARERAAEKYNTKIPLTAKYKRQTTILYLDIEVLPL